MRAPSEQRSDSPPSGKARWRRAADVAQGALVLVAAGASVFTAVATSSRGARLVVPVPVVAAAPERVVERDEPAEPAEPAAGARGAPLPKAKVDAIVEATKKGARRRFALVVGVCGYAPERKLTAPCEDARAVRDALVKDYGYARGDVLFYVDKPRANEKTDGTPTAENLKLAVEGFRKKFGDDEESSFLFYYSGHGGYLQGAHDDYGVLQPAGFFTTAKSQPVQHRGWDMQQLLVDLKKGIPSKHIMVVLDCCYSGWAGAKGDDELDARVRTLWNQQAEVVLTAGARGQQSWEDDPKRKEWGGHGAMTAYVLEGLALGEGKLASADRNKDRVVTDEELGAYVKAKVPAAVRTLKSATQTPQFFRLETGTTDRGQFLFVPNP